MKRKEKENSRLLQREQLLKEAKTLTLFSDTFLSVALNDIPACQHIVRILTGRTDLRIKEVRTQYTVSKIQAHGARLDVLAEDENKKLINIEIQNSADVDHVRRVRFYAAVIDGDFLAKGAEYDELPELYIIYISRTDILKCGETVYHMEKRWEETGERIDDGIHVIFVNAEIDDGSEIAKLMEYFKKTDPEDMSQGALSQCVRKLKQEEEEINMCEYSERLIAFGREEGREEGKKEMVMNLVAMEMPLEKIAMIANETVEVIEDWINGKDA